MVFQLPPPIDGCIFENLSCDLWNRIYGNNSFHLVGRSGQKQDGVDVIGRDSSNNWIGIQCKWKSIGKALTEKEIQYEVEKTKKFKPPLSEYYILTTSEKDRKLEKLAREITDQHLKQGLFKVSIWGWGDIQLKIQDYRDLMEKYGYSNRTPESMTDFTKSKEFLKNNFSEILGETQITQQMILSLKDEGDIDKEFQKEIDYAKRLMEKKYRPAEAYDYLEELKNRVWDQASEKSKYRILTNMGAAKIEINELNEAAYLLIEAYQYNKESEGALTNVALGHLFLKEYDKVQEFLGKVLEKNPYNPKAHSIKIDLLYENGVKINDIIGQVPGQLMNKKEIAVDLAQKALSQKQFNLVEKFIERIDKKDMDSITDEIMGNSIIQKIIHKLEDMSVDFLKEADIVSLKRAITLVQGVWDEYKSSEMRKQKIYCLINLGIAESILGNNDKAEVVFLQAKKESPGDPNVIKNLGLFYLKNKNFTKSIGYFEEVVAIPGFEDVNLYLGQLYFNLNQFSESESYLKKFLETANIADQLRNMALILMVEIFSKEKRWIDAEALAKFCDNKVQELFIASRVLRAKGQKDKAIDKLRIAKKELKKKPMNFFTVILAIEFHQFQEFQDAIELFEKVANKDSDTEITQRLLLCYYYEKKFDKALEISKNLRNKYGPLELITEIEINIYEIIGNLEIAEELYKEFTLKFPKHRMAVIRYALLKFRLQKIDEVKTIVSGFIEKFKLEELQEDEIIHTASLLNIIGKCHEAVKLIYNGLKKYPNKQEMHEKYFSLLLYEPKNVGAFQIEKVGVDTAVKIKDEKGEIHWKIIENENPDVSKSEISDDNPLAKEMFGKKVGDKILFKDSPLQREFGVIEVIKHKYIFKLHEIMRNFEINFPTQRAFYSVQVDTKAPKLDRDTKGFDVLFNMLDESEKRYSNIIPYYVDGRLPVGAISSLLSTSPLKIFFELIYNSELSIHSCRGTTGERKKSLSTLNKHSKLIADITSITTMSKLGIWDVVTKAFGEIAIIQETIDELYKVQIEFEDTRLSSYVYKEKDKYFYHKVEENHRQEALEFIIGIVKYVEKYCKVVSCNSYLSIEPSERDEWEEILGSSFYKTVLIASEIDNAIHYSDDMRLREWGCSKYRNNGVWTQALLMHLLHESKLSYEEYSALTLKLVTMGFKHTGIDAAILFMAAQETSWLQKPPFSSAIELLNGKHTDESSFQVAVDFLFKLWEEPSISLFLKNHFTNISIEELLKGRDRSPALRKLKQLIDKKFLYHPFYLNEIKQTLKALFKFQSLS
jgi:tetratricopeptide (TPR) repeat protein